jgi:inorganic pyrophosphatase
MVDGGEDDQKIIAVPVSKVDPDYEKIKSVADLAAGASERLAAFFRVYKQDANGDSPVILSGYGDAKEALAVLREAFTRAAAKAD